MFLSGDKQKKRDSTLETNFTSQNNGSMKHALVK